MSVLRSRGYDGASLNELAGAAGLKKASLYHRFSGGKKEMTEAVLQYADEWAVQSIYRLLLDQEQSPSDRLHQVIENIRMLYADGEAICIWRALSMDTGLEPFGEQIKNSLQHWIDAFIGIGEELGIDRAAAQQKAMQSLIEIQGSLIVSKGLGTLNPFKETLMAMRKRYLQA